jgi:hypothetical protein
MIKSAAIVKTKTLAPWKELRLQKRKLKKAQTAERKATKQIRPSPIGTQIVLDEPLVEDSPATREEMLQQAEAIGLKVDKRWSDATLLKHIEELTWAIPNDNS